MANKLYDESAVSAIAAAIRGKNGTATQYKIADMAAAITAIPTGASFPNAVKHEGTFVGTGSTSLTLSATLTQSKLHAYVLIWADSAAAVGGNGIICTQISFAPGASNASWTILNYNSRKDGCYTNRNYTSPAISASGVTLTTPSNALFSNGCTYHYVICEMN